MPKLGLRASYHFVKGEFAEGMREHYRPIAVAAKAAMVQTGDAIRTGGRAQIAAAGFKRPYQTAFRVDVYPGGGKPSANAAAVAYHKVDYSETFEEGARIAGKPYLWVPLSGGRGTRVGRKQLRVKDFKARGEKLFLLNRPGKPPLLMGKPLSGMKAPGKRASKAKRDAFQKYETSGMVPLFVGVSLVNLPKKFAIYPMIAAESERVAARYFNNLKAD